MATDLHRTLVVSPPPRRAETANVVRALFLLGFWSVVALQLAGSRRASGGAEAPDPPFVARFQSLDASAQRTYRALQEGLVEAERGRARRGEWPTATALADELVPPFAPDPLDRAGYTWTSRAEGTTVNYVGSPAAGSGAPTFVAIIVEPERGAPRDPAMTVDEVHHEIDGAIVHVATFVGDGPAPTEVVPAVPFDRGWRQILVGPASVIGR